MITMVVHMRVKPENVAAFEAIVTSVRDQTRANEPGVIYYDFAKSVKEPDTYVAIEVYRDVAAQQSHMQTEWVKSSIPKTMRLIEGKVEVKQYVSPGAEPVPPEKLTMA
jgi:quinol monooxygenase YgiN